MNEYHVSQVPPSQAHLGPESGPQFELPHKTEEVEKLFDGETREITSNDVEQNLGGTALSGE